MPCESCHKHKRLFHKDLPAPGNYSLDKSCISSVSGCDLKCGLPWSDILKPEDLSFSFSNNGRGNDNNVHVLKFYILTDDRGQVVPSMYKGNILNSYGFEFQVFSSN